MISQSGHAIADGKRQIMLPLELSSHDPSTKLECCCAWLRYFRKRDTPQLSSCYFDGIPAKCATASISAVCGNMSSGVTEQIANLCCNSSRSRARVGGLHET